MTLSELFLPEFDQEMARTRQLLERVPDGNMTWKPHEKSMTLGRLAGHVAELPQWAAMTFQVSELDLAPPGTPGAPQGFTAPSRAALLEKFDQVSQEARTALAAAGDDAFHAPWTLKFGGREVFTMPRLSVFRSMVMNHLIHHRAQLGVYLRLEDIPIPGMYGPSADEGGPLSDPRTSESG